LESGKVSDQRSTKAKDKKLFCPKRKKGGGGGGGGGGGLWRKLLDVNWEFAKEKRETSRREEKSQDGKRSGKGEKKLHIKAEARPNVSGSARHKKKVSVYR